MIEDILALCGIAFVASFLNVFLEYRWVYSRPDFLKLHAELEDLRSRKEKESKSKEPNAKKIRDMDKRISDINREHTSMRLSSMLLTPVLLMATLAIVNNSYDGYVVARLPFEPFSFFQGITHKGLMGTDYRQCSAMYVYLVAALSFRPSLQRIFGIDKYASSNPLMRT
jgi:hypothetical protein